MLGLLIVVIVNILLALFINASRSNIFSPESGYITVFLIQSIFCIFYQQTWEIELNTITILIFVLGNTSFVLTSIVCNRVLSKTIDNSNVDYAEIEENNRKWLHISNGKLVFFLILQLITVVGFYRFFMTNVGGSSLGQAIYAFRYNNHMTNNEKIVLPHYLGILRGLCMGAGYIFAYSLAYSICTKIHIKLLVLINFAVSILINMITGGRGDGIRLIVAFFVLLFMMLFNKRGYTVSHRQLLLFIAFVTIGIFAFQQLGNALGREKNQLSTTYYIALYLAAELKNLDTIIWRGRPTYEIGSHTFGLFLKSIGLYDYALPDTAGFNYYHGLPLGNVYTCYYNYWIDWGMLGVIILTVVMAVIIQLIFFKAKDEIEKGKITLWPILYAYIFYSCFFSFFANKFYGEIVNLFFVKMVLSIWIAKMFFINTSINRIDGRIKLLIRYR